MTADFRLPVQLTAALVAFILGAAFGFLFDVLRFLRVLLAVEPAGKDATRGAPKKRFAVPKKIFSFVTDLLLSLFFAVCFCILSYVYSYGMPRAYTLIPSFAGFALFRRFPGGITARIASSSAYYARAGAGKLLSILVLRPVLYVVRLIEGLVSAAAGSVSRKALYRKRKRITGKIASRIGVIADLTTDPDRISAVAKKLRPKDGKGGKGSEKHFVEHNPEAGASPFRRSLRRHGRKTTAEE